MEPIVGEIDEKGAIVSVYVGWYHLDTWDAQREGSGCQEPLKVNALIDTGSSCTQVAPDIASYLRLRGKGTAQMLDAGHTEPSESNLHRVCLWLEDEDESSEKYHRLCVSVACVLANMPFKVLLGRDVLEKYTLFFDGKNKKYKLER